MVDKITDSEKLMYDIMGAIADGNVPFIYKGAMITKLILQENDFNDFTRETQDIDASWAGERPPPMQQLTDMLNRALSRLGLRAVVKRDYGEKISAGFKIVDASGDVKLSIDIDMRFVVDSRTYRFGNVTFQGVTPDNVLSDKIYVISSDRVFRRAKDLIDVFALAHCVTVKTENILRIWEREDRETGDFNAFKNRRDELRHSYEKLRRVSAKPEFDTLYCYLANFLTPFVESKTTAFIWNYGENAWVPIEAPN